MTDEDGLATAKAVAALCGLRNMPPFQPGRLTPDTKRGSFYVDTS